MDLDVAGELLAGERATTLTETGWPWAEVAAVEFADLGADFPVLEIGNLGYGEAGAGGVAELEGLERHAPVHHVEVECSAGC